MPAEPKFRLAVVQPGRVIGTGDADRRQPSGFKEICRHLSIVDGLVHADIEQLALSQRMIEGGDYCLDEVVDMHEITLEGMAFGIAQQRYGSLLPTAIRDRFRHQGLPIGATEQVVAEGQREAEIVLLHDPRGPQSAPVDAVLNAELGEHHFFEDFGKSVTAGIGAMGCVLGHRPAMVIEEMSDSGIAADEDELPRSRTDAKSLKQPEHSLDSDIHHDFRYLLAGGEMDDMSYTGHRRCSTVAIGDGAGNDLQPVGWFKHSLMTQSTQPGTGISTVREKPVDKAAPYFAGRTGDKKQHGLGPDCANFGGRVLAM